MCVAVLSSSAHRSAGTTLVVRADRRPPLSGDAPRGPPVRRVEGGERNSGGMGAGLSEPEQKTDWLVLRADHTPPLRGDPPGGQPTRRKGGQASEER
eukprot:158334-Chlamydomonas_euryale.AAC.1